jgi:crossover junction endodeoxyribonuclease RuvC
MGLRTQNSELRTSSIILGIDPGYERCGFAIIQREQGKRETLLFSECFKTSALDVFEERLLHIGVEFEYLVTTYTPDVCALEKLFFTSNQKTAMHVAEVRGMLLYLSGKHELVIREFGPNEIKVAIAGDGRASKQQMMSMVPRLISLPHTITSDDEFDAIAVALTASATRTLNSKL